MENILTLGMSVAQISKLPVATLKLQLDHFLPHGENKTAIAKCLHGHLQHHLTSESSPHLTEEYIIMARDVVRDHGDDGMPRGLTVTVSTAQSAVRLLGPNKHIKMYGETWDRH